MSESPRPETCFRTRSIVFTRRDELAFSRVLREFDSRVTFFEVDGQHPDYQEFTDRVANLSDSRSIMACFYLPEPGREKDWHMLEDRLEASRQSICYFNFWRSRSKTYGRDDEWPLLDYGRLAAGFPCRDRVMQNFVTKILRLLTKVTWDPPPAARGPEVPNVPYRHQYGLDACRWSQQGAAERRGIGGAYRVDPSFDIPLNKYYDDTLWQD